jgi:hypothetical protein
MGCVCSKYGYYIARNFGVYTGQLVLLGSEM